MSWIDLLRTLLGPEDPVASHLEPRIDAASQLWDLSSIRGCNKLLVHLHIVEIITTVLRSVGNNTDRICARPELLSRFLEVLAGILANVAIFPEGLDKILHQARYFSKF